jgi:hypothetical protein
MFARLAKARLAKTRLAITGLAKSGLAKSGYAKFWPVPPRHVAPAPYPPGRPTYCNDNLPGLRRSKGPRRMAAPALACHWFNRNGRLECRWQAQASGGAPSGLGECDATDRASGLSPARAGHQISQNRLRTVVSGSLPDSSEQRSSEANGERAADRADLVCCMHVTGRCHLVPLSARLLPIANCLQ